jgi:hypothetical protein
VKSRAIRDDLERQSSPPSAPQKHDELFRLTTTATTATRLPRRYRWSVRRVIIPNSPLREIVRVLHKKKEAIRSQVGHGAG